jgi:serine-type D-Ala-D-Ala carboxypeptidase/endopeptidase (penicillin-binding protein 4)
MHKEKGPSMRNRGFVLLLSAIVAGCAGTREVSQTHVVPPSPLIALSSSPYPRLKAGVDALFADSLFPPSNVGIKVVSFTRGETLYAMNDRMLFNPASNEKLVTSSTALSTLGTSYVFSTRVFADTALRLIVLRGEGDPLTSTSDLDSMARATSRILPGKEPWRLAVDVSFFDDLCWGSGWAWDEEPADYGMFISPLTLNNNTISVKVQPGYGIGAQPLVTFDPPTSFVSLENTATTVADSPLVALEVSRHWREHSNTITVAGQMRFNARTHTEHLSLWKPELYAGTVFADHLRAYGVSVVPPVTIDTLRSTAFELVRLNHGIDTVLTFLNKVSDNLAAECVLKTIGARKIGGAGSAEAGITCVHALLARLGVDTTRVSVADGSGLSRYNLTSPATIIRLLQAMYSNDESFPALYHALPIAGVDGTISSRMRNTLAAGNLRAKTGSLSGVSALSGYVRTLDGEMLGFSILMQNFPGAVRPYRNVQDAIGAYLAGLKRTEFE